MTHDALVSKAAGLFGGQVIASHTRDAYRDKLFAALREANAGKPDVERWKFACEVLTGAKLRSHEMLTQMRSPDNNWADHYRKQLEEWLQHFLDHDLTDMLATLHKHDLAAEYSSTDPATWGDLPF
jgi:hypothetical protein